MRRAGWLLLLAVILALPLGALLLLEPHLALPERVHKALFMVSFLLLMAGAALGMVTMLWLLKSGAEVIAYLHGFRLIRWVVASVLLVAGAAMTVFFLVYFFFVGVEAMELWQLLPLPAGLLLGGFVLCRPRKLAAAAPPPEAPPPGEAPPAAS